MKVIDKIFLICLVAIVVTGCNCKKQIIYRDSTVTIRDTIIKFKDVKIDTTFDATQDGTYVANDNSGQVTTTINKKGNKLNVSTQTKIKPVTIQKVKETITITKTVTQKEVKKPWYFYPVIILAIIFGIWGVGLLNSIKNLFIKK